MKIIPLAKYRLNYKSFGKRCPNKGIQELIDSILKSFYNLSIENVFKRHKQLDFKDISNGKVQVSTFMDETPFVLRLLNLPCGVVDLFAENIIKCEYDVDCYD